MKNRNVISVVGGIKHERHIAEKCVAHMIDKLMPRMKTLDIEVEIKNIPGSAIGYCDMQDTNREFTLEIQKGLTLKELVTTVVHEMIHVKQYARNEMDEAGKTWKRCFVVEGTGYYDLPWEKEAYRLQDKYAQSVWDADIL
jgi:hypothetical protein